jgi:hypothetical protein
MSDSNEGFGSRFMRLLGRSWAFLQVFEYSSFDYLADRMNMLENEADQLKGPPISRPLVKWQYNSIAAKPR